MLDPDGNNIEATYHGPARRSAASVRFDLTVRGFDCAAAPAIMAAQQAGETMKIIWLGHSGFRIEIAGEVLLIDPWLTGNPMFPAERRAEAIAGATHILLTHGHGDHSGDAVAVAGTGDQIAGIADLIYWLQGKHGIEGIGFNKGGTIHLGEVAVTMVTAVHSSSRARTGRRRRAARRAT